MKKLLAKYFMAGTSTVLVVASTYLIIPQEGEVLNKNGEHVVYKDIVGVATACWGQTGKDLDGTKITVGDTYSEDYCSRWFAKELIEYNTTMKKYVKVELKPYEEIAYTSFVWNLGETNFKNSTLLKKINAGKSEEACNEILNWNRVTVKGVASAESYRKRGEQCFIKKDGDFSCTVKGLTNRRTHEYRVCLGKDEKVNEALKATEASKTTPETLKQDSEGQGSQEPVKSVIEPSKPSVPVKQDPPEQVCSIRFVGLCFNKPR